MAAPREIPQTMRCLAAPQYCKPAGFEVMELPVPQIQEPDEVLVQVHAAGLMTADMAIAAGSFRLLGGKSEFPIKIGVEAAGIVVAVGRDVKSIRPGDKVVGMASTRPVPVARLPGLCAEYAVLRESLCLARPAGLSAEEATALVAFTLTAYQAAEEAQRLLRRRGVASLAGLTVLVPGALSATGAVGIQLLRHVYGVGRVVSTVSTAKMRLVERYLPGLVDQLVDYTATPQLEDAVGAGSVDFVYDTRGDVAAYAALLNRDHGVVVSIAVVPTADALDGLFYGGPDPGGRSRLPLWLRWAAGAAHWWYGWLLATGSTGRQMGHVSGTADVREDLEKVGDIVAGGLVKPVMTVVGLNDLEGLRAACERVRTGKGGLGKLVVKIR